MPYIVTTIARAPREQAHVPQPIEWESRRAVATLDEAQRAVAGALAAVNVVAEGGGDPAAYTPDERARADEAIGNEGGRYSLPDGTVIEVERR